MSRRTSVVLHTVATLWLSALLIASGPLPAAAQDAKVLYWQNLAVRAHLDAEGRMHVSERHVMFFNGDWNGGYRALRLNFDQTIDLERLVRIDENGREIVLVEGDLDQLDHYGWSDETLRWRSRLPTDPPFRSQVLTYVLEYTLSGILTALDEHSFWLNHDFAFADREGVIDKFTLDFTLDSVWQPEQSLATSFGRDNLPPGESFVVNASLRYNGRTPPAGVYLPVPFTTGRLVLVGLAAGIGILAAVFFTREASLGRFRSLRSAAEIDERWLQEQVLRFLPEEVGAVWDDDVGPAEVAALVARLEAEGKIRTAVETKKVLFFSVSNLRMWLQVPLSAFDEVGYEKALIDAFFGSAKETDTEKIRARYKSSGFNPAGRIAAGLKNHLKRHPELRDKGRRPSLYPTLILMIGGGLVLLASAITRPMGIPTMVFFALPTILFGVFAVRQAGQWRTSLSYPALRTPLFLVPALVPAAAVALLIFHPPVLDNSPLRVSLLVLIGLGLVALGIFALVMRAAASIDGPTKLEWRQRLAAARNYFRTELRRAVPQLRDAWFPYIVAFGLGRDADRWFRRFGAATSSLARRGSSGSTGTYGGTSTSGRSESGSWSGGGGQFGGAGAGGTWVAAVGVVAAGVSKPSSSGSGGSSGGGGGGSSSGGGGGGGW